MKPFTLAAVIVIFAAACQPAVTPERTLPTVVELPSETHTPAATDTPTLTDTPPATHTSTATFTPSATQTASDTPTATLTETEAPTLPPTIDTTLRAVASATAFAVERPVFSTFTPVPTGQVAPPTSTGTPEVIAEVLITERQFQEEVNLKIGEMPQVDRAIVDFVPQGIVITVTALGDDNAFTTADLLIFFGSQQGVLSIQGALSAEEGAPEPPQEFVTFVTGTFFLEMVDALDVILSQRLGENHDLETLVITDETIEIALLVPQP